MKWIPEDVANAVVWMFSVAICIMMLLTVVMAAIGRPISERGFALFEDIVKIMLGAVIGFIGGKISRK